MSHSNYKTHNSYTMLSHYVIYIALLFIASGTIQAQERGTFVHLFEWSWEDVATECETFLGPKGFAAVQVSPPQEHISGSQWWTRYQPTSYNINSRSGDRNAFKNMIDRCQTVGVDVYVDAVINHMAAGSRNFPSVPYYEEHFHKCFTEINYGDRSSVQNCGLSGLNDLDTGNAYVQDKIANYLNDLLSLNVSGFRFDAAKHMASNEVDAIISRINGNPYLFHEVIGAANEPVKTTEYTSLGNVTEFQFEKTMAYFFRDGGQLKDLRSLKDWDNWLNSNDAVVFVANHDDQRQHPEHTLTHKDQQGLYYLANIYMLAYPYGYPKVMSSYHFNDHDQGPPSNGPHTGDSCESGWVCEHRWQGIANMVAFRNATANDWDINNWWDNGNNQIAFGRGTSGFVAINKESGTLSKMFQTDLPAGEYCNVINGDFENGQCSGSTVIVNGDGSVSATVNGMDALAIHIDARICTGSTCEATKPTTPNVPDTGANWDAAYFRGTPNDWSTTEMAFVDGYWMIEQTFSEGDGFGPARFKISRFTNWEEAYPKQDFSINEGPGKYSISFNDATKKITVTKIITSVPEPVEPEQPLPTNPTIPVEPSQPVEPEPTPVEANWNNAYIVGSSNDWTLTPMQYSNGLFVSQQVFEAESGVTHYFRITNNADYQLIAPSDSFVSIPQPGKYAIVFNPTTLNIEVLPIDVKPDTSTPAEGGKTPVDGESGTIYDPLPAGAINFYLLIMFAGIGFARRKYR